MPGRTTYISREQDLTEGNILTLRKPKAGLEKGDTVVFCNRHKAGIIRVRNPRDGSHYLWFTTRFRWPDRYGDIPVIKDNCIFNER